jgi:hypothetical protein
VIKGRCQCASSARWRVVNWKGKYYGGAACNTLSSLLYRPDDDPVKGRNIVAKIPNIFILGKELC